MPREGAEELRGDPLGPCLPSGRWPETRLLASASPAAQERMAQFSSSPCYATNEFQVGWIQFGS